MNWSYRLAQWAYAMRLAGVTNVPWFGLVRAVLSGPVPRSVWRARMRTCLQCPLYSNQGGVHLCRSIHPDMMGVGCGCHLPMLALTAEPYRDAGCYGRTLAPDLGWGAYRHPSLGARLLAPIRFFLGK